MDGLGGCHAKRSESEREGQILRNITYMWNLNNKTTSEHNRKEAAVKI